MKYPVLFVSLGPGDPELITLKSLKALQCADLIFCPATLTKDGIRKSRSAELLKVLLVTSPLSFFTLPMSKNREAAWRVYDEVFVQAKELYGQGKRVVIVVEGDASIYASIHYVLDKLVEASVPVEQLPGIPSFIAASSAAALHLIQQEERLVVIPGNITLSELDSYLSTNHVLVIMKLSQCASVVKEYLRLHSEHTCYYFENVGTPQALCLQSTQEIGEREIPYFSLLVIK